MLQDEELVVGPRELHPRLDLGGKGAQMELDAAGRDLGLPLLRAVAVRPRGPDERHAGVHARARLGRRPRRQVRRHVAQVQDRRPAPRVLERIQLLVRRSPSLRPLLLLLLLLLLVQRS